MKNKVREYRKKENISPENLANIVGVSVSMIYQVERGEKDPSLKVAQKISKALNRPTDKIFLGHLYTKSKQNSA